MMKATAQRDVVLVPIEVEVEVEVELRVTHTTFNQETEVRTFPKT